MDHLRTILPSVLQKRGLKQHADAALVLHRANAWLSEQFPLLRGSLSAHSLEEDGTLLIACDKPAAAQECLPSLPHLKVFLREECGFSPVRSIRLMRTRKAVEPA